MSDSLQAAIEYAGRGWAVLPLHSPTADGCSCGREGCGAVGKHPRTRHGVKDATTDKATIRRWWKQWPDSNVGIETGAESGLVVLDVDPEAGGEDSLFALLSTNGELPETVEAITGGGGRHLFFSHPADHVGNSVGRLGSGLDVRGDGGFVVAPPSRHESGERYGWKPGSEPDAAEVALAPDWLIDGSMRGNGRPEYASEAADRIPEGRRNTTLTSLAGTMRQRGMSLEAIEAAILAENMQRCDPPLGEAEVRQIAASIGSYSPGDTKAGKKATQKAQLLSLTKGIEFFSDERQSAYARILRDGHFETWPVRGGQFRSWLSYAYYQTSRNAASSSVLNDVLGVLVGRALFEGPNRTLHNRLAWHEDALWYDLSDEQWRAVRIDAEGWEIVQKPPPLFRRFAHQRPQVVPERGGNLGDVLSFLNVADEANQILIQVWLPTALLGHVPRSILIPWGPQGSAKTFLTKVCRALIDPSSVPLLGFPNSDAEMAQMLDHHAAPFFDNLSTLNRHLSDVICRAVTGDGFSKRRLYSDDDDVLYHFRRVFVLNGINVPAMYPDLLDRSILVRLNSIPDKERLEESELWAEFQKLRPSIVGAMFEALSAAIRLKRSVKLRELPRMADWTRWGFAVAEALGIGGQRFLEAYSLNRKAQNEEALESHPVGAAIEALMREQTEWAGSPSELLQQLSIVADEEKIDTAQKLWPRSASWLTRRINEVETNLREVGIRYERLRGDDRGIRLSRFGLAENGDGPDGADGEPGRTGKALDATDATDGITRYPSLMHRITVPR